MGNLVILDPGMMSFLPLVIVKDSYIEIFWPDNVWLVLTKQHSNPMIILYEIIGGLSIHEHKITH